MCECEAKEPIKGSGSKFDRMLSAINMRATRFNSVVVLDAGYFNRMICELGETHNREVNAERIHSSVEKYACVDNLSNGELARHGLIRRSDFDKRVDDLSDSYLAKHGLVRLPKDADGVTIHTGERMRYRTGGQSVFGTVKLIRLLDKELDSGEWDVVLSSTGPVNPSELRHVTVKPADTPASLADELDRLAHGVSWHEDCERTHGPTPAEELHGIADRLRKMGGDQS